MEIIVTRENKLVKKTKKPVKVCSQGLMNEYGEIEITYEDFFKIFDGRDAMITVTEVIKEEVEEDAE